MPIIAISRGTFGGGLEVAECVAETLGLECVSREILADAAESTGLPLTDLHEAIEKPPSILGRLGWDRARYLASIRAALCRHARSGRLVYHGHGGHILLEDIPRVCRVLVVADLERRIRSAVKEHGFDRYEAVAYIEKIDDYRTKWTRFLYGREWQSPFQYDLVINLARMTVKDACGAIAHLAAQPSFTVDEETLTTLRDQALASTAEAALLSDRRTRLKKLVVKSAEGIVTVQAVARSRADMDAVREVLGGVDGVKDIQLEMAMSMGLDSI
jgi:cytidylate kinase